MTDSSAAWPHLHINSQCLYLKVISPSFPLNIPGLDEMVPPWIPTPWKMNRITRKGGCSSIWESKGHPTLTFDPWAAHIIPESLGRTADLYVYFNPHYSLILRGFPSRIRQVAIKLATGKKNKTNLCQNGFVWVLLWRGAAVCSLTNAALGCHKYLTHTGECGK